MKTLRVSLVQQPIVWQDPGRNRAQFEELLLPEMGAAALVTTLSLDAAALRAFRSKFPAHLDANAFTLEA